ncbi:acetyl-CoA carboxylase, biotin carboxylase subunit [Candidatus Zixiibacteriota bacterium]|nr:acetyl-CoA carboxylase, biotin carboxylase subunit [candidate division Zixibacteria bacterium]
MSTNKFKKILIANRGEIAIRVIRACRDAGITSVAVYSEIDKTAYHVRLADEAYYIGPAPAKDSYLNQKNIIDVAKKAGVDAIHPGYGFLAENDSFARLCEDNGIIFIGPRAETIALLGDKLEARRVALKAGLPVVPGTDFDNKDLSHVSEKARAIGFPILVKAAAGGGGKGMRVVESEERLQESVASAIREAGAAFGDGRVYFEKYLHNPRHIEIQIFADGHGHAVYLGERECSIQRRHQKVIEESPSPIMTPELRREMGEAAVNLARESGYLGAGTVEFLVDSDLKFYFLEVNTRLQVEHPVTEMVTGLDLVREQIRVAEGAPLSFRQESIRPHGHAIECRIYAEDPHQDFLPSTGTISEYREPAGPGIRVDSGVVSGSEIAIYYDPIIAKLVVWGRDREEALERCERALTEYRISGLHTTIGFACSVIRSSGFRLGQYSTGYIDSAFPNRVFKCPLDDPSERAALAAVVYDYLERRKVSLTMKRRSESPNSWVRFYRQSALKRIDKG